MKDETKYLCFRLQSHMRFVHGFLHAKRITDQGICLTLVRKAREVFRAEIKLKENLVNGRDRN